MISQDIQLSRLLFTLSSILCSNLYPETFESVSGLLTILLLSITVIPHGALDHIVFYQLYHQRHDVSAVKKQSTILASLMPRVIFYSHYLSLMVLWAISWQYQMSITFIVFLGLSAYHFGEGDLDYILLKSIHQQILFLSRGVFLLSLAILTRPQLTMTIVERFIRVPSSSDSYSWLHDLMIYQHLILLTLYGVLNLAIDLKDNAPSQFPVLRYKPSLKIWIYELAKSVLFWVLFKSMNPLVAFLIYLGPWHSVGHMLSEITSLKHASNPAFSLGNKVDWSDVANFLYITLPFTLISLISMTGAYLLVFGSKSLTLTDVNAWAVFVVSISILTGPHLWVVAAMHYETVDLDPLNITNTFSLLYRTLTLAKA